MADEDNVVYNIVLSEGIRLEALRNKKLDLYVKDGKNFVPAAIAYDKYAEEVTSMILKKKKARYVITFTESFKELNKLPPAAGKLLRFFVSQMKQNNKVDDMSYRDLHLFTGINMLYIQKSIATLLEKDFIRFEKKKQGRVYMVNPTYFYAGKMMWVFKCARDYNVFGDGVEKKDVFDL